MLCVLHLISVRLKGVLLVPIYQINIPPVEPNTLHVETNRDCYSLHSNQCDSYYKH